MDLTSLKMRLMSIDGVVAVGRTSDGIVVYVRKGFKAKDKIPDGVIIKEMKSFKPYMECRMITMSRVRPAFPGVSVGHYKGTAGTLGGIAELDGKIVGVSANHVIALRWGRAKIGKFGDPVLQPGPFDGGEYPRDMIGRLYRWKDVHDGKVNVVDAAVFRPIDEISTYIPEIGEIEGVGKPYPGIRVKKFGRTTLKTSSYIEAVDVSARISNWGTAIFDKQFMIKQPFANDGDSGSFVLDSADRVVGMIIAGNEDYILATPIRYVEKELGIKIVGVGIYE